MRTVRVGRRKNDGQEPGPLLAMEPRGDAYVQIRLTDGELAAWKLEALRSGRSVSEFVRLVVRQAINGGVT